MPAHVAERKRIEDERVELNRLLELRNEDQRPARPLQDRGGPRAVVRQRCSPRTLAAETAATLQPLVDAAQIRMTLDPEGAATVPTVSADTSTSGAALRSLLAAGAMPDLILMDILLPDADGVALLGELRAIVRLARVPVVALTAQPLAGDEARLRAAGFNAVITKPIDTRNFAAHVAAMVEKEEREERSSNRGA